MIISYNNKNTYIEDLQEKNREKRLEIRKKLFEERIEKNKEENKTNSNKENESVFLDISEDSKQKLQGTKNNSATELQELYKKLREYENKVLTLTKKLNFTDNEHQANGINEKIIEFNQKISAIKEQIQNITTR